jgi:hypothetical protein
MQPDVPTSPEPIAQVSSGMRVIDADGEEVGTVDTVKMGDPNAVTVQAPPTGGGGMLSAMASAVPADEPDVPADAAARLMRAGYVKVDGVGLLTGAIYVTADQVADVTDDVVQLRVRPSDLVPEE